MWGTARPLPIKEALIQNDVPFPKVRVLQLKLSHPFRIQFTDCYPPKVLFAKDKLLDGSVHAPAAIDRNLNMSRPSTKTKIQLVCAYPQL